MLHDSTIASGSLVPVVRFINGKKTNFITRKINIIEIIHPLMLSSFQTIYQKSFRNFLNFFLFSIPIFYICKNMDGYLKVAVWNFLKKGSLKNFYHEIVLLKISFLFLF